LLPFFDNAHGVGEHRFTHNISLPQNCVSDMADASKAGLSRPSEGHLCPHMASTCAEAAVEEKETEVGGNPGGRRRRNRTKKDQLRTQEAQYVVDGREEVDVQLQLGLLLERFNHFEDSIAKRLDAGEEHMEFLQGRLNNVEENTTGRVAALQNQRGLDGEKASTIISDLRNGIHEFATRTAKLEREIRTSNSKWSRDIAQAYNEICHVCGAWAASNSICSTCTLRELDQRSDDGSGSSGECEEDPAVHASDVAADLAATAPEASRSTLMSPRCDICESSFEGYLTDGDLRCQDCDLVVQGYDDIYSPL
jgi:hypothetical protein